MFDLVGKHAMNAGELVRKRSRKKVDFSKQLNRIMESGAHLLFTPQHYNEVPLVVRQAKTMGD